MKNIVLLLVLSFSASLFAKTVTGTYKVDNCKEVSISVQGKDKVVHPDKRGRFSVKDVDLEEDVLLIHSPNGKDTFQISLQGHSYMEISEQDSLVDVMLIPRPFEPATAYDGIILMQKDLLMTGETNSLAAVKVKYPQSPATSFNGSMEPLYFLDGIEVSDISHITIQETAYVEVVRPSNPACTSFGSRGGNGLILLTTQTRFSVLYPEKDRLKKRHLVFLLR